MSENIVDKFLEVSNISPLLIDKETEKRLREYVESPITEFTL